MKGMKINCFSLQLHLACMCNYLMLLKISRKLILDWNCCQNVASAITLRAHLALFLDSAGITKFFSESSPFHQLFDSPGTSPDRETDKKAKHSNQFHYHHVTEENCFKIKWFSVGMKKNRRQKQCNLYFIVFEIIHSSFVYQMLNVFYNWKCVCVCVCP